LPSEHEVMAKEEHPVIIAPVPHLNKSLAGFNKNPFHQGFLTGIVTINLCEFFCFVIIYSHESSSINKHIVY